MTAAQTTPLRADEELVRRLRNGDEEAFAAVLDRHHGPLVRYARTLVSSRALAEEIAQETWLGVIRGLEGFRGECSLKTWIYRILLNIARTKAARESRSVPFSALIDADSWVAVDPDRFLADGHWASTPTDWRSLPDERLLAAETLAFVERAIDELPALQQQVITLRDVTGWSAGEVCDLLDVSSANQRVLLHRARARVRAALDEHLAA